LHNPNEIITTIEEAQSTSEEYDTPPEDAILIALNVEGAHSPELKSDRIRFRSNLGRENRQFYTAVTNTPDSRWTLSDGNIFFMNRQVGTYEHLMKDTCDSTYFRRFHNPRDPTSGTAMTINSNSRSNCRGCKFCGTYELNPEDRDNNDLTTPERLRKKIDSVLSETGKSSLAHVVGAGIVTGCFNSERATLDHILMLNKVLREEYGFAGEFNYVGSQIRSIDAIQELADAASPAGMYLTVECFTRRDKMLKPSKRISLPQARHILETANNAGLNTNILYVCGLDPLEDMEREMKEFSQVTTEFPVVNTFQEYKPGQSSLRTDEASGLKYYLKARNILERIFRDKTARPRTWENYRGLFFTRFAGEPLNGYSI